MPSQRLRPAACSYYTKRKKLVCFCLITASSVAVEYRRNASE